MPEILQNDLPADLRSDAPLPGVWPLEDGVWLHADDAYAAQMAYRRQLITHKRDRVIWQSDDASDAIDEAFEAATALFVDMQLGMTARHVFCPDGVDVDRDGETPLAVLGKVVQEDICILQKQGDEHVLTAAVLCFPASWTLAEKAGQPLGRIHLPVDAYDTRMAGRVQRMFDGVQVGKPLWRNNYLFYDNPELFQPLSEADPARRAPPLETARYTRAERQCIVRLPKTDAVVFSIHTYVVRNASVR